ncbi:hypothetical protein [Parapedobacter koreensis]|uniref:Uncharacterized protein n=1 Tax=Parapedobacter koreensis TaxID=332977 RepID=A0A1H7FE47_9SPHI|nr:hypothetical protein [Parapedobacter koreensis]SEK24356.1 hypothetical protein SAMN05421740_101322 [Parapedobacter koreensis]
MEYEFKDIPVEIEEGIHFFNYRYTETSKYGQACYITSEGKTLVIDENFEKLESTMPESWKKPIIDKLQFLLEQKK